MSSTPVSVDFLGRALAVRPVEVGRLLEDYCTVNRTERVTDWEVDADGSRKLVTRNVVEPLRLFWRTEGKNGNPPSFCTFAGFGVGIIKRLRDMGYEVQIRDLVADGLPKPELGAIKGVAWRNGQREVFAHLLTQPRGIVVCPTAFGKTFLVKLLARVYPTASIVVTVPVSDVARDIFSDLQMELGKEVGMIGAGKYRPERVNVVVSKSLHKAPKDANLILVDECHSVLTDAYLKMINHFRRAKIFGLTASPLGRSDGADRLGEAVFGPTLIDVSYQEGVSGGNIVQLDVRMYRVTEGPVVDGISQSVELNRRGIWRNTERNKAIVKVVRAAEAEIGPDGQLLIMVDVVEHAYILGQLLPEYAVVSGPVDPDRVQAMQARGLMSMTQQPCTPKMREQYRLDFEQFRLKRVIATKIWKQGVDFRDLAVLVRADGTASKIDAIQIPGRLSRLGRVRGDKNGGLLIDFIDDFSRVLKNRSLSRLAMYRKNGWNITTPGIPA